MAEPEVVGAAPGVVLGPVWGMADVGTTLGTKLGTAVGSTVGATVPVGEAAGAGTLVGVDARP